MQFITKSLKSLKQQKILNTKRNHSTLLTQIVKQLNLQKAMIQQVQAQIQTFLQQVNCIHQHPLHYTYILHKTDGLLHLYDHSTMDIVGKTKVVVLDPMRLFAFTNDFNLFYGLRQSRFLIFQLSSSQWLAHIPIQTSHESKPYLESYHLCYYSRKKILICVTSTNFYFVNPIGGGKFMSAPMLKHNQGQIYPQKVAQMSGLLWVLGYGKAIYLLKFEQNFQSYQIWCKIDVGSAIIRLSGQNNPKRQFAYVINDQNQVLLIKILQEQKRMQVCYKFHNKDFIPLYLTLLRPGINTSTSDKFRNRIYLSVYCQEIRVGENTQALKMIDQEQQVKEKNRNNNFALFIVTAEIQYLTSQTQKIMPVFALTVQQQSFVVKNMPQLKTSPWINVFSQNCLFFLTTKNQISFINYCKIKQLRLSAQQWVCMGYRFQLLEKNQVYQQRQDQFQDQAKREQKQLTRQFLDDWSQSILPKNVVLNKAHNRIRTLDL